MFSVLQQLVMIILSRKHVSWPDGELWLDLSALLNSWKIYLVAKILSLESPAHLCLGVDMFCGVTSYTQSKTVLHFKAVLYFKLHCKAFFLIRLELLCMQKNIKQHNCF